MSFVSRGLKAAIMIVGLMFAHLPATFAQTRLFVPDYRVGGGFDTQLVVSNNGDRDTVVDLWAFRETGQLLGQEQLRIKSHAIRSLTLGEAFRTQSSETNNGWLAVVSDADGIQMSYRMLGDRTEFRDAEAWPKRELGLNIEGRQVIRLSNTSSAPNTVTIRSKDETGGFIGLQELSIGPFQQIELPTAALKDSPSHIDVLATSDILANVGDQTVDNRPLVPEGPVDAGTLSLVIDRDQPVGAYQVLLRFDPTVIQFSQDDILGGSAAGFDSKPLVVNVDNASGELRLASFQIGNEPNGLVDVAHIRARLLRPSSLQLGITVEEVTDLTGHSAIDSTAGVQVVWLN